MPLSRHLFLALSVLLLSWVLPALDVYSREPERVVRIQKSPEPVKVDGVADEPIWAGAEVLGSFFRQFPEDTGLARMKTEVRIAFDSRHLHIFATCYEDSPRETVLNLRRDFALKTNDNFSVVFDPYLDGTNGFNFAVTPLGTQREALVLNGEQSFVLWDNRWFSAVKRYPDRYVVEMSIPFTTLRYTPGLDHWKINFSRTDVSANEISTWVRIPRTYSLTVLSLSGSMYWSEPLRKAGTNISAIPFVAGSGNQIREKSGGLKTRRVVDFGGDAKIAVTSALNLDLTVNPDFSNVEVDRQVANLSRFEIFFPEQRQFFNENNDLFSQSGFTRIRPFFSRRIGLSANPQAPGFVQNRILYGARLSGKLNPDLRAGLLNVQTANDRALGIDGTNFTVATFQQKVFGRSNVAGMFVNRQVLQNDSGDFSFRNNRYNRVLGIDYNLLSRDNRWSGKFFYHQSFDRKRRSDSYAHAVYLAYNVPKVSLVWNHEVVGMGYNPETGYLQRPRGFFRIEPEATWRYFYKNSRLNFFLVTVYSDVYWDRYRQVSDQLYQTQFTLASRSTAAVTLSLNRAYTRLYNGGFDPTNTGSAKLDSNSSYWYNSAQLSLLSDNRRRFFAAANLRGGQYFNGHLYSAEGVVSLRTGVWATWSVNFTWNQFVMPEPQGNRAFLLLGPRAEMSFSKSHFFTAFFQYNQQAKNVNVNARYQWRFAPMSDLFLVYSENYDYVNSQTKNRALVLKLVYWLNL